MVTELMILALLLSVVPAIAGGLFVRADREGPGLLFRWVSGQFLLWAGFQLICVPLVLKESSFGRLTKLFWVYTAAVLLLSAAAEIRRGSDRGLPKLSELRKKINEKRMVELVLWAVFWGLLLFQLIQAVRLTYADGDDAYYVAVATITEESDTMYGKLAYTGGGTELDARHGLAPFPVWIAFLAHASGMRAVTVAHVALPVALIAMTYAIFGLLGKKLFPQKGESLPLFLIFTELLVLFGNYSIYSAENFLIARSRQGKAALGNIVIPFLLLLLILLMERLQEKARVPAPLYLLFGAAAVTGCLCSTLGALLICMATGIAGVLGAVCYRRPGILFPLAVSCVPCLCYAFLYMSVG